MILFQQNPKYNYLELKSTKMRFEYKTLPLMIPSSGLISLALIFPVRVYLFTITLNFSRMCFEYRTLPLMIPSSGLIALALIFPVQVYLFTITLNLSRVSADLGDLFSRLLQNFAEINPRKVT